jgi:hypothetical protein
MLKIHVPELAQFAADLERLGSFKQQDIPSPDKALSESSHKFILKKLEQAQVLCTSLGLQVTADIARKSRLALTHPSSSYGKAQEEFDHLTRCFATEIRPMWLLHLSPDEAQYFYHDAAPFGQLVAASFPEEVQYDIGEACKCLGLGRDTAAVFHLMRIAEHGLRLLALKAGVRVKKAPLLWAEWRELIEAIRTKKVAQIVQKRRGKIKEEELEFYRGILGEFEAFKDAYRNQVSHSRKRYEFHEAASVMGHVREFMSRLARKVSPTRTVAAVVSPSVDQTSALE